MKQIDDFLAAQGAPNASDNEDFFPVENIDGVMCRHDASQGVAKRFLKNARMAFNFSYYARAADPKTARAKLEEIRDALKMEAFTGKLGLSDGHLTVVAQPTPVSRDEAGIVEYTSSYRLEFMEEV